MAETAQDKQQGWGKPANSRKFHYFLGNGYSLCGRWLFFGDGLEDEYDDHTDNCAACMREVAKLRKAEGR